MKALDLPYEYFVELNGGEHCGICGALPSPHRRLDRDHVHTGDGIPRGVLCRACNRVLNQHRYGVAITAEWLRAAATYLERTEKAQIRAA